MDTKDAIYDGIKDAGIDFVVSVLIGLAIIAAVLYGAYLIAFKRYAKAHPVILGGARRGETLADAEEDEKVSDDDNLLEE